MSFEAWSMIENLYQVIILVFIVEVYSKVHDQQSKIYKIKTALIIVIQQTISEYCKITDINSSCCMRKEKSLILYWVLDSEFYHFKKQIKIMKQLNIDLKKMRNLINSHLIQIMKSSSSAAMILSSANLVNKNKWKSDQDEQFRDQSDQSD